MSIKFPDTNIDDQGAVAYTLELPATAATKAINTGFTTAFFMRAHREVAPPAAQAIVARANGGTGGNDARIQINAAGQLDYTNNNNTITTAGQPNPITLIRGQAYLVLLIANAGGAWLVACEPGGTPQIQAVLSGASLFAANFTVTRAWARIGGAIGAPSRPYYGAASDFAMWVGSFPEVAGAPDPAIIQALASGARSFATLHTLLDGGAGTTANRRYHYPMRHAADRADAFGLAAPMTAPSESRATGRVAYTSGPILPEALAPAITVNNISQVAFATPGDAATARTTIGTDAGAYAGITPARIVARLIDDETEAVVAGPVTVDAAPSGGAWAANAGAFPTVLMRASYLRVEYQAQDGAGTALTPWVAGHGLRGAGFHMITSAQSQLMFLFGTGSGQLMPDGSRGSIVLVSGDTSTPLIPNSTMLSSGMTVLNARFRGAARGIRQAIIEINARFPGVPVQIDTVGQAGNPITQFFGAGLFAPRWAALAQQSGVTQPYFLGLMGHSSGADAEYENHLGQLVALATTALGAPIKILHFSVPRYKTAAATTDTFETVQGRRGARAYCWNNPADNLWMGSWSSVTTNADASVGVNDPHPADTDAGQGRSGGMMGWALMSAARAVPDVPVCLSVVNVVGSTAVIRFGAVNT